MNKINNINFRLTPYEHKIIISYENQYNKTIVLTPNYNDVYEYAKINSYLEWIEDDIKDGDFIQSYRSITFQQLLQDQDLADQLFHDYINKVCKENTCLS